MFSRDDIRRLESETFIERVEYHEELSSTNDYALRLARDRPGGVPRTLVIAEQQTAGRGRGQNLWWSAEGALTFSLLLESTASDLPVRQWPQISLTTGLAVCDAIDQQLGGRAARLKWPNDVYLNDRKVCGILVETIHPEPSAVVVGVGINVNNSLQSAPSELHESAVALCDLAGQSLSRTDLLVELLQHLESQYQVLASETTDLRDRWQHRCMLSGRTVRVDVSGTAYKGTCRGIDSDGALQVETPTGMSRHHSGVVTLLD